MPRLTSPARTIAFGKNFASRLRPGDVVILHGAVGAGKTTFTKGVAKGLRIRLPITSPTFVVRKRYAVTKNVYGISALNHMDAYRLETVQELRGALGALLADDPTEVWLVEWGKQLRKAFAGRRTWLVEMTPLTTTTRLMTTRFLP